MRQVLFSLVLDQPTMPDIRDLKPAPLMDTNQQYHKEETL